MSVIPKTSGKDYTAWGMMRRVIAQCFEGETSNAAIAPIALSNENVTTVNNAGTGLVNHFKSNAADITEFTNTSGAIFDGPVTFAGGAAFSESTPIIAIATAGAATYTAAQMDNTVITRDCNGASRTDVTATAAQIVAAIPGAIVGSALLFRILNISASDLTVTLSAGAGVTLKPAVITIPRLQFHSFIAICTNVTAAAEAVTVYSMLENGLRLIDTGGLPVLELVGFANAVNDVSVSNAATGSPAIIGVGGPSADANAGLTINSKGTGAINIAPGTAAGTIVVGGATQTGQITLGSSSGAETVVVADGAGAPTVNIANTSTAGATVSAAGAVTAAAATDTVNIATGNAAATGFKKVNILTGTPGTSGNNRLMIGGGATTAATINATATAYGATNFIATETGANNALVAALTDAAGANITVAAGLEIRLKLAHTLQIGANTLNLNGHGTDAIKSHNNVANNIAAGYASGSIIHVIFDGTQWQDLSQ